MNLERNKEQTRSSDEKARLMGDRAQIVDDERVPEGYVLYQRQVALLNGRMEPAFYGFLADTKPDPDAWEQSSDSVIEGFIWALTVAEFADNETDDDDRTQEIGNMMSYAVSQGLTEEQVVSCYETAFFIARNASDVN